VLSASQPLAKPSLLPQVSSGLNQRSSQPHPFSGLRRTQALQTQGLVHLAKILPNLLAIRKQPLEIQAFLDRHNLNSSNNRKTLLVRRVHLVNRHSQRSSSRAFLVVVVVVLSGRPANQLLRPLVVVSWLFLK
jgi:hypothetical protein